MSESEERVSGSFLGGDDGTPGIGSSPDDPPLILRGGKVNPEAIELAYRRAAEAGESDESMFRVRFELSRDLKCRLDKYLTSRIAFMSRNQLQHLIGEGGVTVNGADARPATKLRKDDVVEVVVPPPPSTEVVPQEIPIEVLFEDEHLIVLNKQADIIVHPARAEKSGTLINALAWHFRHTSGGELSPVGADKARPGVVHRLDRNTTGCILFAKTEEAHWKLGRQFEFREVDKRYLAFVHGRVAEDGFVIDKPIGPHPSKEKGYREKMVIRHDELGKPSITIVRVRERYRLHTRPVGDQDFALVELELKTGRTHQIRVHLSEEGVPIVGDDMYGGRAFVEIDASGNERETVIDRQALHAALLAFQHPITGETMSFVSPLPDDARRLLAHLRTGEFESPDVGGSVSAVRLGLGAHR
jgi:23S rRNA pseudouridine1911/1915/1917 synthase